MEMRCLGLVGVLVGAVSHLQGKSRAERLASVGEVPMMDMTRPPEELNH